jgi:hypothetical protein
MLIVGSERVYTGVRGLPLLVHWEDLEQTVAVFLGTSLGGQDRILPEITWIFQGRDAPAMILGLGFQWNFSRPAAP